MKERSDRREPQGLGRPTRGPVPLSEALNDLFAARGFARHRGLRELEAAWESAIGPELVGSTRLGGLRRGVLNITVTHPAVLEELAGFRKPELLAALRRDAPGTPIQDLRFRVGSVN